MAGMSIRDMRLLSPGFVIDMVIIRTRVINQMFGGKKKKTGI